MTKRLISISLAVVVLAFASSAGAFDPPFSDVNNVCETCEQPKADVITLTSGQKIRGQVVGENSSFYTVVRYTEARAIPRGEVKSIDWANGSKPASLQQKDQILLKNGVVFSGSIVDDKDKPSLFQLKSDWNGFTYVVFKAEVKEAYKSGQKHDFK